LILAVPDLLKNVIFTWFQDDKKNTNVKKYLEILTQYHGPQMQFKFEFLSFLSNYCP